MSTLCTNCSLQSYWSHLLLTLNLLNFNPPKKVVFVRHDTQARGWTRKKYYCWRNVVFLAKIYCHLWPLVVASEFSARQIIEVEGSDVGAAVGATVGPVVEAIECQKLSEFISVLTKNCNGVDVLIVWANFVRYFGANSSKSNDLLLSQRHYGYPLWTLFFLHSWICML
jgi:hypothetical protein